jgi:small GTP-binding protein
MQSNTPQVKVVLLGESGVGKSSFMLRFVANNFKVDSSSTVGASYMFKIIQVNGRSIKFNIWDTAGQERYHSLAKMYLHDANAAILVYDITNRASFEGLPRWYSELTEVAPKNIIVAVAGNKEDLVSLEVVQPDEAQAFASSLGGFLKKTSAKTNQGIESVFKEIGLRIFNETEVVEKENIQLKRQNSKKKEKKNCC